MPVKIEHLVEEGLPAGARRLFIKSYGCQMNQYDAQRMADVLRPHGYHLVESPAGADLVILNTCHIREKADDKVFSDLGRMVRVGHAETLYAVGGCVGQAMGKRVVRRAPDVNIVFGPQTYHRLPEFIAQAQRRGAGGARERVVDTEFPELEKFDRLPTPGVAGPAAFLSIQEGCDKFCTYCVVPYTRGAEISRPLAAVENEARLLVAQGVREITLLGQNVNAYHGEDDGKTVGLAGLIRRLAKLEGLARIRFTTSHPANMGDELIALFGEEEKLMPYLHLPVQAGSDKILKAMNRAHGVEDYMETIHRVRQARPDIAISGDFIVGFPGETEEDYLETLALVAEVEYATAYSFAYSPRPGTPAAVLENQVADGVKKERLAGLQALLDDQQHAFNRRFEGETVEVLVEGHGREPGQLRGYSPHNLVVNFSGAPRAVPGDILPVKVEKALGKSLLGSV